MASPVDAFEAWLESIPRDDRIFLEVAATFALPEYEQVDQDGIPTCLISYLRAPRQAVLEVVGRLGFVRALVDLQMLPHARPDLEAVVPARIAVQRAQARALGENHMAEMLARAEQRHRESRDLSAAIYVSWDDLLKGPLSTASIYEWWAVETGGTSRLLTD